MRQMRRSTTSSAEIQEERCSVSTITSIGEGITEKPRTIKLEKDENGYGFFLKKLLNSPMHLICDVEEGTPAQKGGLKDGDILGCVNGKDVMHDSHIECVQKIRDSGDEVELTVASRSMMELFYKHGISVTPETKSTWLCMDDSIFAYTNAAFEDGPQINTSQTTVYNGHKELTLESLNGNLSTLTPTKHQALPVPPSRQESTTTMRSTESLLRNSTSSPPPPRLCNVKRSQEELGFQLNHDPETQDHIISHVIPHSPADEAGLRDGDKILEINDASTFGKTHQEILNEIATNENEINLLVVHGETTWQNMEIKAKAREDIYGGVSTYSGSVYECFLVKEAEEEFEFFLMVDSARNCQVITEVLPGGPADRSGLKNGDILIEVDGINVENKPHKDVVKIIKERSISNQIRFLVSGQKRSLYIEERKDSCVMA